MPTPTPASEILDRKIGHLTPTRHVKRGRKHFWLCRCDCGNEIEVHQGDLRIKRSCGCVLRGTTHGLSKTPEYRAWNSMRTRCNNPNAKKYSDYGGRGIKCCPEWDSFEQFYKDMGAKPDPSYTLERKEVNGDYTPENCIWIPMSDQAKNKRTVKRYTFMDQTFTLPEWVTELGKPYHVLYKRLRKGWTVERAFTTPYPAK